MTDESNEPKFTRRHWGRELLDVLLLPVSWLMSKHKRNRELSGLRVILAAQLVLVWRVLDSGGHFTMPDVWVLAVIAVMLPVSDLFGMVPVREGLAALVAIFGATVAKRVSRTSTTETETVVESPPPEPAHDGALG